MNIPLKNITHSAKETMELGRKLGKMVGKTDIILLIGDLGAGKTIMTKGIVSALTDIHHDLVTSPSFTLMQLYPGPVPVTHIDLYRLSDASEIFELGIEEALDESVIVIEWGEKILDYFDSPYVVKLRWIDQNTREIEIIRE